MGALLGFVAGGCSVADALGGAAQSPTEDAYLLGVALVGEALDCAETARGSASSWTLRLTCRDFAEVATESIAFLDAVRSRLPAGVAARARARAALLRAVLAGEPAADATEALADDEVGWFRDSFILQQAAAGRRPALEAAEARGRIEARALRASRRQLMAAALHLGVGLAVPVLLIMVALSTRAHRRAFVAQLGAARRALPVSSSRTALRVAAVALVGALLALLCLRATPALALLAASAPILGVYAWAERRYGRCDGVSCMPEWRTLIVLVALGIAGSTAVELGASLLSTPLSQQAQRLTSVRVAPWRTVLLVVVAAPILEEVAFRGLLHPLLCSVLSAPSATLIGSVLFAVAHGYPLPGTVVTFCLALICVALYEVTGRLRVPILVHALGNALALVSEALALP